MLEDNNVKEVVNKKETTTKKRKTQYKRGYSKNNNTTGIFLRNRMYGIFWFYI